MHLHFKADNVRHLTPPLLFQSFPTLTSSQFFIFTDLSLPCFSFLFSLALFYFFSLPPLPSPYYLSFLQCSVFIFCPFFPSPYLLFLLQNPSSLQYLCARGLCCGCRCPARKRRQSTRQGRGVRTRCSLETAFMLCRGPPIALTCCMNMPPGKTLNRTEPRPITSECASHCPTSSNSIGRCKD